MTARVRVAAVVAAAGAIAAGCAAIRPGARAPGPSAGTRAAQAPPPTAPGTGTPASGTAAGQWLRLESPHFILTSTRSAAASEVVLRALEEYFAALTTICFPGAVPGPERMPVILLANRDQSRRVLRSGMSGVFFSNLMYQPLIVLGENDYGFQDAVVRHELVHYAVRLAFRRGFPRWFEEGLASYYESLATDRVNGQLLFGKPGPGKPIALEKDGLVPTIATLVNGELDDSIERHAGRFYISSWLLVHFLIHGAPDAFGAYQQALIAGADPKQAWLAAAPPAVRDTLDAQLRSYAREKRYQVVRRVPWQAPAVSFRSLPLPPADVTATEALLQLVGTHEQAATAAAHRQEALELVGQALGKDAANLLALRIALDLDQPISIDHLRAAVKTVPDSWVAWLTLYDALGEDRSSPGGASGRAERTAALARAVAIAPDEAHVLLRRGNEALRRGRWDEASGLFLRGLSFAPDVPSFYRGYLMARSRDPRCGKLAAASLEGADAAPETPEREWRRLIEAVESCRATSPARKR